MGNFKHIQQKLGQFIKKYYTNELIKGTILFVAFGLLYFLFTLLVEYFLWLRPTQRSILFYVFVLVELTLLIKYIVIPFAKMLGLQKGITIAEASKIIGKHFPEVDDKLLNVLQLYQNKEQSELLLASIEQKSASLQPIPFQKAIDFKGNIKYLNYLAIPLTIWFFSWISGKDFIFQESLNRVVHYQTAYEPPAPFSFIVVNDKMSVIEGQQFELQVETVGTVVPENVQISFNGENYFLKDINVGTFSYVFNTMKEPVQFYLEANGVKSKDYVIEVIKIPAIIDFQMVMDYPAYTGHKDELIKNTGNATIPEGTTITWKINTKETDSLSFSSNAISNFLFKKEDEFSITKRIKDKLEYQISSSNKNLKNYEKLHYSIDVIKDEFPAIQVKSDIDSVTRGPVQFAGQLNDDYGLKKLELVYYDSNDVKETKRKLIAINKGTFEEFYYIFSPDSDLEIEEGKSYQIYFEIFDNDGVNGSKSTKSQVFTYYNKTKDEITDDLLKEQKQRLDDLNNTSKESEKLSKELEDFSKELKKKPNLNWNDKKEFDQFLERQEKYQQMLQKQTDQLLENLNEQEMNENDNSIKEKKDELLKRMEEAKELQKRDDLLKELQKMAEKLDKENMLDKLDKLSQKNKQETRSLERLLELTKRFFVEKKANQISNKLDSLSQKQEKLSNESQNNAEKQQKLNEQFDVIQQDFDELEKQNHELIQPMVFPITKQDEQVIDKLQGKALEELKDQKSNSDDGKDPDNNNSQKAAQLHQKAASKKMKQLSEKMKGAMSAMQGEMINENIDDLKAILENLLTFSFDQEQLMLSLEGIDANSAEFPNKLKKQQLLKEHFEHVDDSLYALSFRVQQLSAGIQEHLTEAHYNIDKSLENIAENRIQQGIANQLYTMTSANNLADMLSDLLNSLQNSNSGQGKGNQNQFTLPDIIQKQKGLSDQMQKNTEQNSKEGEKGQQGEKMSGELYQIYKQ
ncbi:MAG: hypothetical protein KDC74_04850, partial [Flavobacteriaceae bacterium]|nr:hypothetical protein [Flavobacteriaceae bacterium]